MIKISRLADYAVVILVSMVEEKKSLITAGEISNITALPVPTVAKVLKIMAKSGIVDSVRGASGGYRLSRPPSEINVADIVSSVDGPIALTACVDKREVLCDYAGTCLVEGRWREVNAAIAHALQAVALSDMIALPGAQCCKTPARKELSDGYF